GAEDGALGLVDEFAGAQGLGVGELPVVGAEGEAAMDVGDEGLLFDRMAVVPGVAIEGEVTGDGAPVEGGEEKGAESGAAFAAGVGARTDEVCTEVGGQAIAGADLGAGVEMGEDVAEAEAGVRDDVGAPAGVRIGSGPAEAAL